MWLCVYLCVRAKVCVCEWSCLFLDFGVFAFFVQIQPDGTERLIVCLGWRNYWYSSFLDLSQLSSNWCVQVRVRENKIERMENNAVVLQRFQGQPWPRLGPSQPVLSDSKRSLFSRIIIRILCASSQRNWPSGFDPSNPTLSLLSSLWPSDVPQTQAMWQIHAFYRQWSLYLFTAHYIQWRAVHGLHLTKLFVSEWKNVTS